MEKEILSIDVDEEYGTTEVTVRVPDFDNLGHRLNEIERLAFEAELGDDDFENDEEKTADPGATVLSEDSGKKLQEKINSLPNGPEKESLRAVQESIRKMKEFLEAGDEEPGDDLEEDEFSDDDGEDDDGEDEGDYDLQLLVFAFPEGVAWDDEAERKVDRFLTNWPKLRPKVLNATFEVYQSVYPVVVEFLGDDPGLPYFLPEPKNPESISDHFAVETIYFRADKKIGLSGHCTWDDEHGWGVLLKDGAVIRAGAADESFA
jgi:hypothetical protein